DGTGDAEPGWTHPHGRRRRGRSGGAVSEELAPGPAAVGGPRGGRTSAHPQRRGRVLRDPVGGARAGDGAVRVRRAQHAGPGAEPAVPRGRGAAPAGAGSRHRPADHHHHRVVGGADRAGPGRARPRPLDGHDGDGRAHRRTDRRLPRDRDPELPAAHAPRPADGARRGAAAGRGDRSHGGRRPDDRRVAGLGPRGCGGRRLACAGSADVRDAGGALPVRPGPQGAAVAVDELGGRGRDTPVGGHVRGAVRVRAEPRHLRDDVRLAGGGGHQHVLALADRPARRAGRGGQRRVGAADRARLHGRSRPAAGAARRGGRRQHAGPPASAL
ncbi:MAG: Ribonuclease BN, partial [uncultured Nocardioides sp.]